MSVCQDLMEDEGEWMHFQGSCSSIINLAFFKNEAKLSFNSSPYFGMTLVYRLKQEITLNVPFQKINSGKN